MYNLEQLRMFVLVAQLGSFSACAKKLGKVQSAVSQGIANLEIDLNLQLFDRSTRKPSLTKEGEHLLAYAQAAMQQLSEFDTATRALTNQQESKLKVVLDDGLQSARFYKVMTQFAERFPSTELEIFFAASADITQLVATEQADLGVMFTDISFTWDIELCFIGSMHFIPVVEPKHSLASYKSVSAAKLTAHRQLLIKGLFNHSLHFQPLSPKCWWANDYRMLQRYVEQGIGWAYLPQPLIAKELDCGLLHALPVTFDHKPWAIPVNRVTPKNRIMGPAGQWLAEHFVSLLDAD